MMTIGQTLPLIDIDQKLEIIFPQGEFWSNEPPLESNLHLKQILLLIQCLEWLWQDRDDYFATGNLTVYYSPNQKKSDYFWFDPDSLEFEGFTLMSRVYQPIDPNEQNWLWSQQLRLYLGIYEDKLRYFTSEGQLVPTPEESAIQARQLLVQEQERVKQLEERLRSLGLNLDEIM